MQPKHEKRGTGALLCLAATLAFSIGGVCVKASPGLSPMALNSGRCFVAALLTGAVCLLRGHRIKLNFAVITGALSVCLTGIFYIFSARLSTAANAIILQYTSPVFVALLLWAFQGQKPSKGKLLWVGVVFCGTVLCCGAGGGNSVAGNLFGLASGLTFAGVFLSGQMEEADALSACLLGELLAGVTGLPFLMNEPVDTASLACLVAMGLIQTGSAYLLLSAGLARTDPLTANLICALEPVANPLWVALLCGEIPPLRTLLGGAVVVFGVVCYQKQQKEKIPGKAAAIVQRK